MSLTEENPDRYVVDDSHVRLATVLLVVGALLIAAAVIAFDAASPLLGGILLLLGICSASLALFFRPGEQSGGTGCFLFASFCLSGAGALILLAYAGIRAIIR